MGKYNVIKSLDKQLLTNYPDVWATRVHWVAVFALPIYVLSGLGMTFFPFSADQFLFAKEFFAATFIPAIIAFLYYAYSQKLFRPMLEYGLRGESPILRSYRNFCLIFLSVSTIALFPYFLSHIWLEKVGNAVPTQALARDVNALTHGAPFFENGYFYITQSNEGNIEFSSYCERMDLFYGNTYKDINDEWNTSRLEYITDKNGGDLEKHAFGRSDYITRPRLEGVLQDGALEGALIAPMTKAEALRRISAYLDVYKRNGYALDVTPEAVLQANFSYVAPNYGINDGIYERITDNHRIQNALKIPNLVEKQEEMKAKIIALQTIKVGGFMLYMKNNPLYMPILIGAFYFSLLLFIINQTKSRLNLGLTSVFGAALPIPLFVGNLGAFILIGLLTYLTCGIGRSLIFKAIKYRHNKYDVFYETALTAFVLGLPVIFEFILGIPAIFEIFWGFDGTWTFLLIGCFITFCLIPYFESLYVRLNALPEK